MTEAEVAIDTETTGLNHRKGDRPFGCSMAWPTDEVSWWQWDVDPFTRAVDIPQKTVKQIEEITRDPNICKGFWNAGHDLNMMEAVGIRCDRTNIAEVSFKARACNNLEFSYELKAISNKYLNISTDDQKALHDATVRARRVARKLGWMLHEEVAADYWLCMMLWKLHPDIASEHDLPKNALEEYGVLDAERTILLDLMYETAMDEILAENGVDVRPLYNREMQVFQVTQAMQDRGAMIDRERMTEVMKECRQKQEKALRNLRRLCKDDTLNPRSTPQLQKVLYEGHPYKLRVLKKTKTGAPATSEEALEPYKQHVAVRELFQYRNANKALNTFFDKYRDLAVEDAKGNMCLHTFYKQWGTLTGRYSSGSPNLQQVTKKKGSDSAFGEMVVDVRQVFRPRRGYWWYCIDYDQLEVIIFADVSGEPTMIEAIKNGFDIHSATTDRIWGGADNYRSREAGLNVLQNLEAEDIKEYRKLADEKGWRWWNRLLGKQISDEWVDEFMYSFDYSISVAEKAVGRSIYRRQAKYATFSKIFGGGPKAVMAFMGDCSFDDAKEILDQYEESFPQMVECMEEIIAKGRENGFVVNPFGRRLAIDKYYTYRAVNYIVQSAAADLMKMGMLKCFNYLRGTELDAHLLLTIHDELIFEIKKGQAYPFVIRKLCKLMSDHEGAFSVDTPVSVDRVAERWSEGKKVAI